MPMVDNILLRTGGGNPTPVYDPELSRFDGWSRQTPTSVRGIPRGRELEHPGHTPARPLEDRRIPPMKSWQVPAFPQIVCFQITLLAGVTEWHTSPPLPTPSIITELSFYHFGGTQEVSLQFALASTPIRTDAELAACPLILKLAPEGRTWATPITTENSATWGWLSKYPLNTPLPNGPRNRITCRAANLTPGPNLINIQFHIQPQ